MRSTFCLLFFRNLHFYGANIRRTAMIMAIITAIMQMTFYYKVGSMETPPPGVFFMYAFDTWVVATIFQTIMTIRATKLMEREKKILKFKYS